MTLAPIIGRTDKKYCSDDCRAQANRLKQRAARQPTVTINEILWKNREVLRRLWQHRPTTVSYETLLINGFHADYHTNLYITMHSVYFVCYDFGFQPRRLDGHKMALIVKMIGNTTTNAWDIDLSRK